MQNGIKSGKSFEFFKIYINDKECCSYKGVFPFWSTNWIQVKYYFNFDMVNKTINTDLNGFNGLNIK